MQIIVMGNLAISHSAINYKQDPEQSRRDARCLIEIPLAEGTNPKT